MSIEFIGMACALGLSAMGSAFGAGFAAQASVGAWKKCYANGKPAPFIMVAFSGAPLTQTIYGFLLMNFIRSAVAAGADPALAMFTGIFAGLAIGLSAFFQGKVAAASADALGETGKGTANFFIVIGIIETVALFTLVFSLLLRRLFCQALQCPPPFISSLAERMINISNRFFSYAFVSRIILRLAF